MKHFFSCLLTCLFFNYQMTEAQVWEVVGSAGLSADQAHSISLDLKSDNTPYITYRDANQGEAITVQSFDGSTWNNVGSAGFSAGEVDYTDIELDPSDVPYVAYMDKAPANGNAASVQKFDGTSWSLVGSAAFSAGAVSYTDLAFDGSVPYIAFSDFSTGMFGKITVMKFNGTSWDIVGTAGFSANRVYDISLVIHSGTPYVAYRDQGNAFKATVMKFESSAWINVGSAGFSAGPAAYVKLVIDGTGTPYVAYRDEDATAGGKASVMKFDGTNWTYVGSQGFSLGATMNIDLELDASDVPFIAFRDDSYPTWKAVVMSYNSGTNSWSNVGNGGFSAGIASYVNIEIFSNGHIFCAYKDFGNASKATVMDFVGNVFPIELESFYGEVQPRYNRLHWATASELNNDYFVIEKSKDGVSFEPMAEIDGAGNSQSTLSYEMVDLTPFPRLTYYRLKQVDFDGTYSYSESIQLKEYVNEVSFFDVFPNPSNGKFRVLANLNSIDESASYLRVISMQGLEVYKQKISGSGLIRTEIQLSDITPGLYLVQILSSQREFHKRLLIQP